MKQTMIAIGSIVAVLLVLGAGLFLSAHPAVAVIIVIAGVALFEILVVLAAFAAGAWWGRESIEMGANIAMDSQRFNDEWDAKKTNAFANLAMSMIRMGQAAKGQTPLPPLLEQGDTYPSEEIVSGELIGRST